MKKEILIQFAAQSKSVVEKVEIRYSGDVEEFENSEKYINSAILKEVEQLQEEAGKYARNETFKRQR